MQRRSNEVTENENEDDDGEKHRLKYEPIQYNVGKRFIILYTFC